MVRQPLNLNQSLSHLGWALALVMVFMVVAPATSMAQATSLGGVMCNLFYNAKPFGNLFQWVAYVVGAACAMRGVHHFRVYADDPRGKPLLVPIMFMLGAAGLLALPNVIGAVVTSLYTTPGAGGAMTCSPGATSGGSTFDVMLTSLVTNIKEPMRMFISLVAILSGLFMMIRGLIKASHYGIDPKTHSVNSILSNMIFGALLLTIGDNLDMIMGSVFGTSNVSSDSVINWSFATQLAGGASTQFKNAVIAALTFVQIIGAIAFVRGWMIMKKVAEGGGNATLAQGMTHILGGVAAINIYQFVKILDNTLGTGML